MLNLKLLKCEEEKPTQQRASNPEQQQHLLALPWPPLLPDLPLPLPLLEQLLVHCSFVQFCRSMQEVLCVLAVKQALESGIVIVVVSVVVKRLSCICHITGIEVMGGSLKNLPLLIQSQEIGKLQVGMLPEQQ